VHLAAKLFEKVDPIVIDLFHAASRTRRGLEFLEDSIDLGDFLLLAPPKRGNHLLERLEKIMKLIAPAKAFFHPEIASAYLEQ
jgi:hypothetical protein